MMEALVYRCSVQRSISPNTIPAPDQNRSKSAGSEAPKTICLARPPAMRDPMPHLVHHKRLRIEWGHCDPAGIVFNSRFFEYFDWSTWEMFETVLSVPRQDLFTTYD